VKLKREAGDGGDGTDARVDKIPRNEPNRIFAIAPIKKEMGFSPRPMRRIAVHHHRRLSEMKRLALAAERLAPGLEILVLDQNETPVVPCNCNVQWRFIGRSRRRLP